MGANFQRRFWHMREELATMGNFVHVRKLTLKPLGYDGATKLILEPYA
jgi:hypothetical protein